MLTRRSMLFVPLLASVAAPSGANAATDDYPSGVVTLVVSFPPGGSLDVCRARMAVKLQERLGKPVVVESRAGASGRLRQQPSPNPRPMASRCWLRRVPRGKSHPVQGPAVRHAQGSAGGLAGVPHAACAGRRIRRSGQIGGRTDRALKEKPGQINFAHGGPGSAIHLAAELSRP